MQTIKSTLDRLLLMTLARKLGGIENERNKRLGIITSFAFEENSLTVLLLHAAADCERDNMISKQNAALHSRIQKSKNSRCHSGKQIFHYHSPWT